VAGGERHAEGKAEERAAAIYDSKLHRAGTTDCVHGEAHDGAGRSGLYEGRELGAARIRGVIRVNAYGFGAGFDDALEQVRELTRSRSEAVPTG